MGIRNSFGYKREQSIQQMNRPNKKLNKYRWEKMVMNNKKKTEKNRKNKKSTDSLTFFLNK